MSVLSSLYSVGLRCVSRPATSTLRFTRSTRNVPARNTEGLGEVVVRTGIEGCDLVVLQTARGEHDDRAHCLLGARPLEQEVRIGTGVAIRHWLRRRRSATSPARH